MHSVGEWRSSRIQTRGPPFAPGFRCSRSWAHWSVRPRRMARQGRAVRPSTSASPWPMLGAMFLRYFVELDLPFDVAERALLNAPEDWIPGIAAGARVRGERLLSDVGFGSALRIEKLVLVELSPAIQVETKLLLPLKWRPTGDKGLLPALEGDIEL